MQPSRAGPHNTLRTRSVGRGPNHVEIGTSCRSVRGHGSEEKRSQRCARSIRTSGISRLVCAAAARELIVEALEICGSESVGGQR